MLRASEYAVHAVAHRDAAAFIREHHYARGCANTSVLATGLFAGGALLGASLWMPPTRVCAESVASEGWRGVLALSRLAVAPCVPTNGASFLIGRSIRLLRQDSRWTHLVTYADESQGHTGAIYRATNWTPQGRTRPEPRWLTADGVQVSRKAGRSRTRAEMEALGHQLEGRFGKLKFTMELRRTPRPGAARQGAFDFTDAQKLASILAIPRAAVASGDARARVLADVEEVARE